MKRYLLWGIALAVAVSLVIMILLSNRISQTNAYGNYITAADVKKATGKSSVQVKEIAAGLEFDSGFWGGKFLEVRFEAPAFYENEVVKNWRYYEPVPGLGEKAAIREPHLPYRLTFLKNQHCVLVQTFPKDKEFQLSRSQLVAIGRIIAGRL